jgi:hypothetical protein
MATELEQRSDYSRAILQRAVGLTGLRKGYNEAEAHKVANALAEAALDVSIPASHDIFPSEWEKPVGDENLRRQVGGYVADFVNLGGSVALGFVVGASTRNVEAGLATIPAAKAVLNTVSYTITNRLLRKEKP